jgi:hypothetical protein|tara:strand:+ start:405 stop:830 length:426 start_codon:yes stop_codon:yes gene_type:complete
MSTNAKRRGSQYEAAFVTQALKRGLDVLEPYGDYMPYDVMVQNDEGRIQRVQVKGTSANIKNKPGYKVIAASGNSQKRPIKGEEVDVLAAYVEPEDCWYLIPIRKIEGGVSVYLNPNTKLNGRYEVWKEAWNVFQNGGIPG